MKRLVFSLILFCLCYGKCVAQRIEISLNDGWLFTKEQYLVFEKNNLIKWQSIRLPHTWNRADVMDDEPGYYQAACWYKKNIRVNNSYKNKNLFLFFKGVNQVAEVYVNGKWAAIHKGGYTGFYVQLNGLLHFDGVENKNEIIVKVDNSINKNIPPLSADFTFYGGIYRDVFLVATDAVHFSTKDDASCGVYLSTPVVNKQMAILQIKSIITNNAFQSKKIKISSAIVDADAKEIVQKDSVFTVPSSADISLQQSCMVQQPNLWSPENPYLYSVRTRITDVSNNEVLDEIVNPLGFRWFNFDANKGFYLNGKPYKLIGTGRHQDFKNLGNALPDEIAINDMQALKKMGGNFVRISHYPQDPVLLHACDRIGLLASVEIPVVNEITESEEFYKNCIDMQKEMIKQNFNHPSVIIWCYMNEVLLKPHFTNDQQRQKIYYTNIEKLAKKLDSVTRAEDPYRYTMIANHGDFDRYRSVGLTAIPMIVGWNLYNGWYGGSFKGFADFLDKHHMGLTDKPLIVSEYGADADPRIRSTDPVCFDKSVEYATFFHQYYFKEMMKRPFVAGGVVWNLSDFNSEMREETMPHINNKGLQTSDRTPKAPYYFYQSQLSKLPYVKILDDNNEVRSGVADSTEKQCYQTIYIASNQDSLEVIVNGQSIGFQKVIDGIAVCNIPFVDGANSIQAFTSNADNKCLDKTTIQFTLHPYVYNTQNFKDINILLGAKRYYTNELTKQVFIPDQVYRKGSFGSIGGIAFKSSTNGRLPYGTDNNIVNTENDPVYQTQCVGIDEYRFDVSPGKYVLTLLFAELQGRGARELVYNLSGNNKNENSEERIFNVWVNDELFLENFNIASQYGIATAVDEKMIVHVKDANGLRIKFKAIKGLSVLNAIQLKKLF
jgi:beta-galactosidase